MRRFSTLSITVWSIILGLGCFAGTSHAANVTDKTIGISIDLDDRFVKQSNWRGYRVFSDENNTASVYIKPVHDLSLYHLREDLKGDGGGFDDVDSIDLVVTGDQANAPVDSGGGVLVPVKGRIGDYKVRGIFSGLRGFDDQSFFVIAVTRPDYWNDWKQSYAAMFDSIRFVKIDYSEMISNWYRRLSGKSLVPDLPKGQKGPKPLNLCSNGTLAEEKTANPKPATPQQQTIWNGFAWVTVPIVQMPPPVSRWLIEPIQGKPILVVRQGGPRPQEYLLEMEDGKITLSGMPHRIADNTLCPVKPKKPVQR